jgi:hypothetical protein
MFRMLIAYSTLLVLLTTGCHPKDRMMDAPEKKKAYRQAEVEAMYRRNPNPTQRYDITMTIENAPGPFEDVRWGAQYDAPGCVYLIDRFAGVHGNVSTAFPVDFKKVDSTTYVGTVYLDAMLDEDYFGNGICKWKLTGAYVRLRATGKDEETLFVSFASEEEVIAQKPTKSFYLSDQYPFSNVDGVKDSGEKSIHKFKKEYRENLFSITMTADEVK